MTVEAEDFEGAFLQGFVDLLVTAGVGAWRETGGFTSSETAIVLGTLPSDPAAAVALQAYGVDDDPSLSDSIIGLQVTTRWGGQDPRSVGRLTSRVFDTLHGLHDVDLTTGVHVVQCLRRSWTSLGQDGNKRWRTAQNFYVTVHRPSAHRT